MFFVAFIPQNEIIFDSKLPYRIQEGFFFNSIEMSFPERAGGVNNTGIHLQ